MNNDLMFSSKNQAWETPKDFFDKYDAIFHFETDVCALPENAKCKRFFTPEMDGLKQEWTGVCWMNPPYGREIGKWVQKAYESAQPKWISVEERLPEPNRKVLTIRMDLSGKGRHAYALDNIIPWTDAIPFIWLGDLETWKNRVTHWMEIPQPPKEME